MEFNIIEVSAKGDLSILEVVNAKSRYEALKKFIFEKRKDVRIYFKGNNPYFLEIGLSMATAKTIKAVKK